MHYDKERLKSTTDNVVLRWAHMENEVVVTRKGQTTIPAKLRLKYHIEEGTRLEVLETDEGILFKPKKSTVDLAGSGAKYSTPEEMKRLLNKLREEDV